MEPLYCWKCGAYDNDCACGWPSEDTPLEDFKYCEFCGKEEHDDDCGDQEGS